MRCGTNKFRGLRFELPFVRQEENMRLAILDSQIGPGLCDYIIEKRKDITPIICETKEAALGAGADAVVASAEYYEELGRTTGETLVIGLKEDSGEAEAHVTSPYNSAEELLSFVFKELSREGRLSPGKCAGTGLKGRVVTFVSMYSRDYLDGISYVYASLEAQKHKTLFVSFEPYDGFFSENKPDVGDLFYELHKENSSMDAALKSGSVLRGDLSVVYPFSRQLDFGDLTEEDLSSLPKRLFLETDYEILVLAIPPDARFIPSFYSLSETMYDVERDYGSAGRTFEKLKDDLINEDSGRLVGLTVPNGMKCPVFEEEVCEELLFGEMTEFVKSRLLTDG